MKSDLIHIEFYFPEAGKDSSIKTKQELAELIVGEMKEKKSLDYSGFSDEKTLQESISNYLGDGDVGIYEPLSKEHVEEMQKIIEDVVTRCNVLLPIPTKNFIFVFPYLPTEKDAVFEGVMGLAPYSCVSHLFVSPNSWSKEALADTVAHELNHTIFYYHHYDDLNNYTLLDEILLEGLAENFRETVLGTKPSPWAVALTKEKAFEILGTMTEESLSSRDQVFIKKVLYGDDTHEKWAGYSVGYWMAKDFIERNPTLSWDELMKLPSSRFIP
ncbi:MAG: hypothetical protein KBD65_01985 [Candidatus Moranbacteria bacterium]|nr:hypothetical protein [Candidatus Moranbacteria bacterium]